jgi:Fic family protein
MSLEWFESRKPIDQVLEAGLAYLWFMTIHPFDDCNGRIARGRRHGALALGAAHRDILELIDRHVLVQNSKGGRSTSYSLAPT